MKRVILNLTELEADMLALVVCEGWGDGDFRDWIKSINDNPAKGRADNAALNRAMFKLDEARRAAR